MNELLVKRICELAVNDNSTKTISLENVNRISEELMLSRRAIEIASLENDIIPYRYYRNIGTTGCEGQKKLLQSTVAVIGLGGLGGYVAEGLARMGTGRLVLIDGDTFTDHNLNRQLCSNEDNLGFSKAEEAKKRIACINSSIETTVYHSWLNFDNASQFLTGVDVVVDCLDSMLTRLQLQKVSQTLGIPMVYGAIAGFTLQIMTIFPGDKGLFSFYNEDNVPHHGVEKKFGNPAATPMMAAAWQIHETVKIITKKGELLRNKMVFVDIETSTVQFFTPLLE